MKTQHSFLKRLKVAIGIGAAVLMGIVTLLLIFTSFSKKDSELLQADASVSRNTIEKPEMTLEEIVNQLRRYTDLGSVVYAIPMDDAGFYIRNNYQTYTQGEDFLRHVERYNDKLDKIGDYPFITNVMHYSYSAKDKLPTERYVRSLIALGADVNLWVEVRQYKVTQFEWDEYHNTFVNIKSNCYTPLGLAATHGDIEIAKLLLDKGADPNHVDGDGYLPLELAKTVEMGELLIRYGANMNALDAAGNTALHYFAKVAWGPGVDLLLQKGADENIKNSEGKLAVDCTDKQEIQAIFRTTPLGRAALRGDAEAVKKLLKSGADPNDVDSAGLRPLVRATNIAVCEELIAAGADVNADNKNVGTVLHEAARCNWLPGINFLLQKGADVNARDKWALTALMYASRAGNNDAVKALLEAGADVNAQDEEGRTALFFACYNGYENVAKSLLSAGADVNVADRSGKTILTASREQGKDEICSILLAAGARTSANDKGYFIEVCEKGKENEVIAMLAAGIDVNARNDKGDTALICACSQNRVACVKLLLEAGADVNAQNDKGETALICACCLGNEACIKLLLAAEADLNMKDQDGVAALMYSYKERHDDIVRMLLDAGCDVNVRNAEGMHLVVKLAKDGKWSFLKELMSSHRNIELTDADSVSLFDEMVRTSDRDIISVWVNSKINTRSLTQNSVALFNWLRKDSDPIHAKQLIGLILEENILNVNAVDKEGDTPLMYAVQNGDLSLAEILLNHRAEVNVADDDGLTALHIAAATKNCRTVKLLLDHGADAKARTNKQETVLHMAVSGMSGSASQYEPLLDLLLSAGADPNATDSSGCSVRNFISRKLQERHNLGGNSSSATMIPDRRNERGVKIYAASRGVADFLPSVNAYSNSGSNALYKRRLNILLPMIAAGATVDVTTLDTNGNTALHYASGLGHLELVRWLLQHGANSNAVNDKGSTPLQCSGNTAVSELLKQYGAK